MKDNLISVIVPIHNSAQYLLDTVSTIQNQTYNNIEILLIDDLSTDNSVEICKEIQRNDNRVKVIVNEKNLGAGLTRNVGIESAKGDYVLFVDADDKLSNDMIYKMVVSAETYKSDVVLCGYDTFVENIIGDNNIYLPGEYVLDDQEKVKTYFFDRFPLGIVGFQWNKLYKTSFLIDNKLRVGSQKRLEDGFFNMKVFGVASTCSMVNEALYHYRLSSQVETFKKTPKDYHKLVSELTKCYYESCESVNTNSKNINIFYLNETVTCVENTFSPEWDMDLKDSIDYVKQLKKDKLFNYISSSNVNLGKYRRLVITLIRKRFILSALLVVKIKVILKKSFKGLFYLLKKI